MPTLLPCPPPFTTLQLIILSQCSRRECAGIVLQACLLLVLVLVLLLLRLLLWLMMFVMDSTAYLLLLLSPATGLLLLLLLFFLLLPRWRVVSSMQVLVMLCKGVILLRASQRPCSCTVKER
jgi:hypothetical protein